MGFVRELGLGLLQVFVDVRAAQAKATRPPCACGHRPSVHRTTEWPRKTLLGPEHVQTVARDGWSKSDVRQFLFDHTGVPLREYRVDDGGEGTEDVGKYDEVTIDGERCYRKFSEPASVHIVVAGGTAGKFSAVIGGWHAGPRGSQMVTYRV